MEKCMGSRGQTQLCKIIEVSEHIIFSNTPLAKAGHMSKPKGSWTEKYTLSLEVGWEEKERIFVEQLEYNLPQVAIISQILEFSYWMKYPIGQNK